MSSGAAVWLLWAVLFPHGAMHARLAGLYRSRYACEHAAAVLNATAPELGAYACFLQRVKS